MKKIEARVGEAIKLFWLVRNKQSLDQGSRTVKKMQDYARLLLAENISTDSYKFAATFLSKQDCRKSMFSGKIEKNCPDSIALKRIGTLLLSHTANCWL
jgi:hypothetical protein